MIAKILYLTVFSNIALLQVSANIDLEILYHTVRNHSNILNEYPGYVNRTKFLEKGVKEVEPKLNDYETNVKTVQESMAKLKNTSGIFTEKLKNFESYTNRINKLEGEIVHLFETVETYGGSLNSLDVFNRRTGILENYVNEIKDTLKNSTYERKIVSEDLDACHQTYKSKQNVIKTELAKLSILQAKQQQINNKLNEVITGETSQENSTSQNVKSVQENYEKQQRELKSEILKIDNVIQIENDLSRKLKIVITEFEDQEKKSSANLKVVENSFNSLQNEIKVQLGKIDPLSKTQGQISQKLDNFVVSLGEVKQIQQILQKDFNDLSFQIQQFIGAHSPHY